LGAEAGPQTRLRASLLRKKEKQKKTKNKNKNPAVIISNKMKK
jgi:hypothetical protein